jgi:hypothetical protein
MAPFELMTYLPVGNGGGFIEWRDMELEQEAQQLLPFRLRNSAFYYHELQLGEHYG